MTDRPAPPPWFGWSLLAATAGGLLLRALHMDFPLRYDEAVTLTSYALQGPARIVGGYDTPNNHVLHTLMVHWSTSWWGRSEFVVRLPAFLAGILLIPATAWWGLRMYGPRVGAMAALLVAATPVLIEFSTNARGYTLLCLLVVCAAAVAREYLDRPSSLRLGAMALLAVLALYTIPVALIPGTGLMLWLGAGLLRGPGADRPLRSAGLLLLLSASILVVGILLYWPIIRFHGWDALIGNRFVEPLGWAEFGRGLPRALLALPGHWARAVPLPLSMVVGGCLLAGAIPGRDGVRRGPGMALLLVALTFLMVRRSPGEPRIWLWALPFVLVTASHGAALLTGRWLPKGRREVVGLAGAVVAALVVAFTLVSNDPLSRSLETGGYPEAPRVAAFIAARAEPGDALRTDYVSREPLQFYLDFTDFRARTTAGGVDELRRLWVIVNRADSRRFTEVATRAVAMGVPLGSANPVTTIGDTDIYLFAVQ